MPPVVSSSTSGSFSQGAKQRKPQVDAVEASHERMVVQLATSFGGMSTPIAQYLQDALSECVEHRLPDPIQFMFHHFRHLKLVLTSDLSSGQPITPLPMILASSSTATSRLSASSAGVGTVLQSSGANTQTAFHFFDRLHRYVFQHEGGRALRSSFVAFQHSGTSGSPHKDDEDHNSRQLSLRSAIFSSFSDLFFVSQRLDQTAAPHAFSSSISLPATELSRIPYRVVLAFCCAALEEHLACVASPQVLLYCILSTLEISFAMFLGPASTTSSSSSTASSTAKLQAQFGSLFVWIEGATCERATSLVKVIVKMLEEILRCGPTTIVTATTRKKKQDSAVVLPPSVLAFSTLSANGGASADSQSASVLHPMDESAKDSLLFVLDALCGSSFAGTSSSSSPKHSRGSSNTTLAASMRINVDVSSFKTLLKHIQCLVEVVRHVAIPLYSLLESRCSLVRQYANFSFGVSAISIDDAVLALKQLGQSRAAVALFDRASELRRVALPRQDPPVDTGTSDSTSILCDVVIALEQKRDNTLDRALSLSKCAITAISVVMKQ